MKRFLEASKYVNSDSQLIITKAKELFNSSMTNVEKSKIAFEFVRDKIPHSFDCSANIVTAKASDVLKYNTGICHAKANLLAALLRAEKIPVGFCFQHLTLKDDDSAGYCLHCFNAIFLQDKWIKVDARGNINGINAQFSLNEPILAFQNRSQYNEYFFDGIYSSPDLKTMKLLDNAVNINEVFRFLPDNISISPDIY